MNCGENQPGWRVPAGAPLPLALQGTPVVALGMNRHHATSPGGRHMRRHPLLLCAWPVLLGLGLTIGACSSSTEIGGYTVTYRLHVDSLGIATFDSLKYDNGTGTMLRVTPSVASVMVPWAVSLTVSPGASLEAHVWAKGVAANHALKLVVVWMRATGALAGDST